MHGDNKAGRPEGFKEDPCAGHSNAEHMAAYDRLPPRIRRAVADTSLRFCPVTAWPDTMERSAIDDATGYKRSSRDTYLQRLKARELVITEGGKVKAADTLFDQ